MSEFDKKGKIGNEAINILTCLLDDSFIDFVPFSKYDSTPDIDGHIRLRDGIKVNLNEYLFFQSKGKAKINNGKYSCSKKVLDFLYTVTTPTILFVVDTTKKEAFWFYPEEERKNNSRAKKSKTLDLNSNRISEGTSPQLREIWGKFAKQTDYDKQTKSLLDIRESFSENVTKVIGLFALIKKIRKEEVVTIFNKLLNANDEEIELIVKKLIEKEIVLETENLYIVENEEIATNAISDLLDNLEIKEIIMAFNDLISKKNICARLATYKHEKIDTFFENLISEAIFLLKNPTTNDELFSILELIEEIAFRIPDSFIRFTKILIAIPPLAPSVIHHFDDGDIYGKDYEDLIGKTIEILKDVRYFKPKEVLGLLIKVNRNSSRNIFSHVVNALKHFAEYNLNILHSIGYQQQLLLVDEIDKWSSKKLLENKEMIFIICEELLTPSFEGTSWDNKETLTITSGALTLNDDLRRIRTSAMAYLKKIYDFSKIVEDKKRALQYLQHVTRTPHHVASEDLMKMIYEDIEALIKIYDSVLDNAEAEIIKEIENNIYWFDKWYKNISLKGLEELKIKIANDSDYTLFRIFVGYDSYLPEDQNKENRDEQIIEFVNQISEENFEEWKKKILKIIKNHTPSSNPEYIYFNKFLHLLGKDKPRLALRVVDELSDKLKNFLYHLLAGLYVGDKKTTKLLIKKWVKENKNLEACADALGYGYEPQKVDIESLTIVLNKAKRVKDKEALRSIVRISFINYSKNKNLKPIFFEGVKELVKIGDTWWIYNIWHRNDSLLKDITSIEADVLLDGLLLMDDVEHHGEEILSAIASKFPKKVIGFFDQRIKVKANRRHNAEGRYSAIPYRLQKLSKVLRGKESIIAPLVFEWYSKGGKKHNWLYRWEASHFIEKVFPGTPSNLIIDNLKKLVKSKDKNKLKIVLSIIVNYETTKDIWCVCKEIIANYYSTKDYKNIKGQLFGVLAHVSGVFVGENGLVSIYENKKTEAESLDTNTDPHINSFKAEYLTILDDRIKYEKKRVAENLTLQDRGLRY